MPAAEDLRRIEVTKPEGVPTADQGLATAPPDQMELEDAEAGAETPGDSTSEASEESQTEESGEEPTPEETEAAETEASVEPESTDEDASSEATETPESK